MNGPRDGSEEVDASSVWRSLERSHLLDSHKVAFWLMEVHWWKKHQAAAETRSWTPECVCVS